MTLSGKRLVYLGVAAISLGAIATSLWPAHGAVAASITHRSLTLEAGGAPNFDPGALPGGTVTHHFTFTIPQLSTGTAIGSIKFQYCTTASGTCDLPGDGANGNVVDTTGATLDSENTTAGGFTMVNSTNGAPYLTRTASAPGDGSQDLVLDYRLGNVVNPKDNANLNLTFFVRITTYQGTDGATDPIDSGTVAAATTNQIVLSGTMPESLIFCTGGSVTVNLSGIPDCSTATSGDVSFNRLFDPNATAYATSQMAASTNALFGYAITVEGPTLSSGSDFIPAIGTTAVTDDGTRGSSVFGMNLVHDTATDSLLGAEALNPASHDVTPNTDAANHLMGTPAAPFNTDGSYAFDDTAPNVIAKSDNGTGTGAPTDSQIYTATYMVNVAGHQVAGTYTTTLTYICTPTF